MLTLLWVIAGLCIVMLVYVCISVADIKDTVDTIYVATDTLKEHIRNYAKNHTSDTENRTE
jgi:hypothetical protein